MTNNIEEKIKILGIILGIVGAVITIICGLAIIDYSTLSGFLVLAFGSMGSLIIFSLMYGFGVIIEKLKEIAKNTKQGVKVEVEYPKQKN